jgi:hypothetical protein
MASAGHIAIGMAAARVYRGGDTPPWSSMVLWSALSLTPDADVIGFALGVQYGDSWGSRADVERVLGSPQEACWQYSWSPQNRRFRLRVVCFLNGKVEALLKRWDR